MVRKLALLVGCNYTNNDDVPPENKLHGCINDVNFMQDLIRQRFHFQDKNITILTDETKTSPTFSNILAALKKMIDAADQEGDTLLFYFSGGGALFKHENEITEGIPAIVPWDLLPITGDYLWSIFDRLRDGATLTFICDSSYSGGLLDKKGEKVQIESNVPDPQHNFHWKTIPSNLLHTINVSVNLPSGISHKDKHIILFSSCRANEESVEVYPNGNEKKAISAFSNAIQVFFNSPHAVNPTPPENGLEAPYANREVAAFTIELLGFLGFYQYPNLKCIKLNDATALFLGGYVA